MAKVLIIKDSDFSVNAIEQVEPENPQTPTTPTNECTPTTNYNVGFWNYLTGVWTYDSDSNFGRNCNTKYLHVISGKSYIISSSSINARLDLIFYNANKERVSHKNYGEDAASRTVLIPDGCYYLCFNIYKSDRIPEAIEINGIKITGTTEDSLVYEE